MKVRWTEDARNDREAIFEYVRIDSPRAALALDEEFADSGKKLADFPHRGRPGRAPQTRELVISPSSYVIVYTIREDVLWILRVLHAAQSWPEMTQ